ncbi:FAD-binding oxidoreductase [Nonomuraea sp. NPDC000554]|uniref:FAD-binding oxidoreductase n=1 Tax=Nonomuraea sp. NPDC000554 TaxID=3154259 RepID=UPI0033194331
MTTASSDQTLVPVAQLLSEFGEQVITPDDPRYDPARTVYQGGIDRRPAAIVRPRDAAQVSRVVSIAREHDLELAVRGGGHSNAGYGVCDGGLVLDLNDMREIDIDVEGRTAWVQAGMSAGAYTEAVGAHGFVTGFGDTGTVGVGGITLGGGIGFLVRKYGLTIDALLAAEIVTADGQILHTDADTHPDLFWAIRGGGGNFGVATRFKFRLHELESIVGGMLILPATAETIEAFAAASEAAPLELTTIGNIMPAPPMPFLPPEQHGQLIIMAMMCYAGGAEDGERALAPFRAIATPLADMVQPMPYSGMFPPDEDDFRPIASSRTMFIDRIDRATAETIVERIQASTASMAATQVRVLGGAMADVPADATAFALRQSRIMVNLAAIYEDLGEAPVHDAWVDDYVVALRQSDHGAYVNFLGDEGEARVRAAYPGGAWERLTKIKAVYDPTNLFRLNQNIPPAS